MSNYEYFVLTEQLSREDLFNNYDFGKGQTILAVSTGRGSGKSTGVLTFLLEQYEKYKHEFAYVRTTTEEIENFACSFNADFDGEYSMTKRGVYKIHKTLSKDGTEKIKKERIGVCLTTKSEMNFKSSGGYPNVRYIWYDEFNDIRNIPNIYRNFCNLTTTIIRRKPDFLTIMTGNKDSQNNTFLVNWGIEPNPVIDEDEVYDYDFYDDKGNQTAKLFYVDYAINTFNASSEGCATTRALASFDEGMDRYINKGGFRETGEQNIVNYKLRVSPTAKPLWNIIIRKKIFECGFFTNKQGNKSLYLRDCEPEYANKEIKTISMGYENALNRANVPVAVKEDLMEFVELIYSYSTSGLLYFTSYDGKILCDNWLHVETQKIKR